MNWFESLWHNETSKDIIIGILSSILASIIVLFSQSFVNIITFVLTKKFILYKLWRWNNPKRMFIVSGSINKLSEITSAILTGLDAEAAHRLIATAHMLYPEAEIEHVYSSDSNLFSQEYYRENLIIVGGPINNKCSQYFLKRYVSIVEFIDDDDQYFKIKFQNKIYTPTENIDFGLIVRDINPLNRFNKSKSILLVAGCDSFGGLAAAKVIDYYRDVTLETQKKLFYSIYRHLFKSKNYLALISCEKLGETVTNISLVDFHIIADNKLIPKDYEQNK